MPKGDSGRVVVELDPSLKRRLYSVLAIENKTLKDWMIERVERYVTDQNSSEYEKNEGDQK